MGLFGRDDRTNGSNSPPTDSNPRHRASQATGSSITLIASTAKVEGTIKGAGEVRVEGAVKGTIDCSATVLIDPSGNVDGEIKAETIVIAGKVNGNVFGTQKIELTPSAVVEGDITSPRILIREGATFEGQVYMTGNKAHKKPEPEKKNEEPPKTENSKNDKT